MTRAPIRLPVFLLGHLGIGLGLAWLLAWKMPAKIDYRFVLFGAILPDLIDKPLGFVLGLQTRLWAHTFLFLFGILTLSFLPPLRPFRLIGFGVATHLLLDLIWQQPSIVLYPLYGGVFPPAAFDVDRWFQSLLHDPYAQGGELVGSAILIAFAWRHRLLSWLRLRAFLRKGALSSHV